ncbi:SAM-dependent methyltransferase [Streptomyces sp. NPDC004111]|uniref:SAM-dependent methyltransferase n=1 Tax=Streptomyces sp. NPDC004111 TaxID=3364690 RepID=UPI00367C4654
MEDNGRVDLSVPSAARMYDWLLGGHNNFAADQEACQLLLEAAPSTKALALNNRWFLQRVVRALAEEHQIRQFVDFGSGLPTQNNVHQIAQSVHDDAHVVYIDNDPVVLAHGRSILDDSTKTGIIAADMADTEYIFGHEEMRRLIDPERPVAVLFNSVLHCIPDAKDPLGIVRRTLRKLAQSDNFVVICQLVSEDKHLRDEVTNLMFEQTHDNWGRVREVADVKGYFEGLEVQPPGLVDVTDWRPESELQQKQRSIEWIEFGGLARVPAAVASKF